MFLQLSSNSNGFWSILEKPILSSQFRPAYALVSDLQKMALAKVSRASGLCLTLGLLSEIL